MTTAYLAGGWFTPAQRDLQTQAYAQLHHNPTLDWAHCFFPEQHVYRCWTPATQPEMFANPEWQLATFATDIRGIDATDCLIALLDPRPADTDHGALWEMGYAFASHKPVVLVLPDAPSADVNLMPALGATAVVSLAELATYDFGGISYRPYAGRVF